MSLTKLTIKVETRAGSFDKTITALFNPNQISIQKNVRWRRMPAAQRDVPAAQFTHGDPAVLTVELFFDTFEQGKDVQTHTNEIASLTTIEKHGNIHRPPICQLIWGQSFFFQGVLDSLNTRLTLFLPDGTPARAMLTCTFREWRSDKEEARRLGKESADVAKTRVVHRGDTLSSIAAEEYNDPALWRPIAQANRITNPRALTPGQVLSIPALVPTQTGK